MRKRRADRDGENTNQDPVTQRCSKTTDTKGQTETERGLYICVCVWPYLHYLCAGMGDEVLLVRIYDSHLD